MSIHIVIVNYFSSDYVFRLLDSIDRSSFGSICIVDNSVASHEYDALVAASAGLDAQLVSTSENLGFGPAVNLGISSIVVLHSDYIWILNPDTLPAPGSAAKLVSSMKSQGADLGSPLVTTGIDGSDVWFGGGEFDFARGRTQHFSGRAPGVFEVNFLTGAALMVSGKAWASLGGFRDDLFMYWEDADLSLRAAKEGYKLIVEPSAVVWHAVGATSSEDGRSELFYYYMQRNRIVVLAEQFGLSYCMHPRRILESVIMAGRAVRERRRKLAKLVAAVRGHLAGVSGALR
ncbi:glycosyltransferase family 2 protein [Rhodococcoides kyotonense]|uniref:Glycosyltransferase 2-like domain-containing protein n=1 Tax=Rhodococcoides kyotonense TaxID=398843 RepID=A0A239MEI7_9NOCA|nr:glycosyltransferase family 2 protein [Rhodococcus kyotonensis]SNT40603.1 hypothetical protein SAMN05421642_11781 [Rhodococcus kyotonensis]